MGCLISWEWELGLRRGLRLREQLLITHEPAETLLPLHLVCCLASIVLAWVRVVCSAHLDQSAPMLAAHWADGGRACHVHPCLTSGPSPCSDLTRL